MATEIPVGGCVATNFLKCSDSLRRSRLAEVQKESQLYHQGHRTTRDGGLLLRVAGIATPERIAKFQQELTQQFTFQAPQPIMRGIQRQYGIST